MQVCGQDSISSRQTLAGALAEVARRLELPKAVKLKVWSALKLLSRVPSKVPLRRAWVLSGHSPLISPAQESYGSGLLEMDLHV